MSYKVQFKSKSPMGAWQTSGSYGSEQQAITAALTKKKTALMVRVTDKRGGIVYVG